LQNRSIPSSTGVQTIHFDIRAVTFAQRIAIESPIVAPAAVNRVACVYVPPDDHTNPPFERLRAWGHG
jgi:hypothetical protein